MGTYFLFNFFTRRIGRSDSSLHSKINEASVSMVCKSVTFPYLEGKDVAPCLFPLHIYNRTTRNLDIYPLMSLFRCIIWHRALLFGNSLPPDPAAPAAVSSKERSPFGESVLWIFSASYLWLTSQRTVTHWSQDSRECFKSVRSSMFQSYFTLAVSRGKGENANKARRSDWLSDSLCRAKNHPANSTASARARPGVASAPRNTLERLARVERNLGIFKAV